jgi:hypothetical protein
LGSYVEPSYDTMEQSNLTFTKAQPNQRLKLTARGGRLVGNCPVLSAAAAGRSLSAIR